MLDGVSDRGMLSTTPPTAAPNASPKTKPPPLKGDFSSYIPPDSAAGIANIGAGRSKDFTPHDTLPLPLNLSTSGAYQDRASMEPTPPRGVEPLNIGLTPDLGADKKLIAGDEKIANANKGAAAKDGAIAYEGTVGADYSADGANSSPIDGMPINWYPTYKQFKQAEKDGKAAETGVETPIVAGDQATLKALKADIAYVKKYESGHRKVGKDFKLPEPLPGDNAFALGTVLPAPPKQNWWRRLF